jgi:hypothetical protein
MALNESRRKASAEGMAMQSAALQNMQQRGIGGAGQELAARLAAAQGTADTASQEGDRLMAMAQRGRLEALSRGGNLAGDISGQEFNQQSQIMTAQDRINQMRAQNTQDILSRNVGNRNAAAEANLRAAQSLSNSNVGISNAQQEHNKALLQAQFDNKMRMAQAKAGGSSAEATYQRQKAQDTAGMYAKAGSGLGQAIAGIAGLKNDPSNPSDKELDNKLNEYQPTSRVTAQPVNPSTYDAVDWATGKKNKSDLKPYWEK